MAVKGVDLSVLINKGISRGLVISKLQHLLVVLGQERPASCDTLQLTYSTRGNQLGSWNLKQVIEEQLLD